MCWVLYLPKLNGTTASTPGREFSNGNHIVLLSSCRKAHGKTYSFTLLMRNTREQRLTALKIKLDDKQDWLVCLPLLSLDRQVCFSHQTKYNMHCFLFLFFVLVFFFFTIIEKGACITFWSKITPECRKRVSV